MAAKLEFVRRLLPVFAALLLLVQRPGPAGAQSLTPAEAQALVDRALGDELRTAQETAHPMRYRMRKSSPRLTTTKEIVETSQGFVARLVAVNDLPLGGADEQREQARLDALLANPGLQRHRKRGEDQDASIVLKILRMLPQAFLYQYAGEAQEPAGAVQKFTFRPNPQFNPPDLETQALTSMTGELWIDASHRRVARLEGHLQQDTDYGWGILGKLDKGGWLVIEQADVGGRQWRIVHVQLRMNLRILFKTKSFDTVEQMSGYAPVPAGIDYRQAIQMLRSAAGNSGQTGL
jgi:hypothetical protein